MSYNLEFDIAALIILSIMVVYIEVSYAGVRLSNRYFKRLTIWALLLTLSDILAIHLLNIKLDIPWILVLTNSLYYFLECVCIFEFGEYVRSYYLGDFRSTTWYIFCGVPLVIYIGVIILNFFKPVIFYIDADGNFIFGKLHLLVYLIPVYLFSFALVCLFQNVKKFTKKQVFSTISFVILINTAILVQSLWLPNYVLCCFGAAVSLLVMMISLETPDYGKLILTMAELEKTKNEAQSANVAKSAFLANMSHEIRTPINGVLGMNEIILKSNPNDEIRECAENIENSGRSLLAIINDILDMSKIESGKMEIIPTAYKTAGLFKDINILMEVKAKEKALEYRFIPDNDVPSKIFGDEARVRQVIINLVSNAIKYTDSGSVTISVKFQKTYDDMGNLCVDVADTGRGIPEESLSSVFDAFTRVDEKQNRKIEGTGLGLRITKQFVNLMNGNIWVTSKEGEGSTFCVVIPHKILDATPMSYGDAKVIKSVTDAETPDLTGLSILAVDDTKVNLMVVKGLLKATNVKLDMADCGEKALVLLTEKKYDLILMDHLMPEMDGIETLKKAKLLENNKNTDTPFIVVTANAIQGAREEYLSEGFNDYISKPFKGEELIGVIKKYCKVN